MHKNHPKLNYTTVNLKIYRYTYTFTHITSHTTKNDDQMKIKSFKKKLIYKIIFINYREEKYNNYLFFSETYFKNIKKK